MDLGEQLQRREEQGRSVELDFETPRVRSPQTPHPICCISLLPSLRPATSQAARPSVGGVQLLRRCFLQMREEERVSGSSYKPGESSSSDGLCRKLISLEIALGVRKPVLSAGPFCVGRSGPKLQVRVRKIWARPRRGEKASAARARQSRPRRDERASVAACPHSPPLPLPFTP